jgi:hypothetical protein
MPAMSPAAPSTAWRETIAADEADRYERYAKLLHELQEASTKKLGRGGRALHRKGHLGAKASFEVRADLAEPYAAGLFARPATYRAYVRFSNGAATHQSDRKPDVRGIAVKLVGVEGKKLIPGMEGARTQDFLAIQSASTPFRNADEFVRAVYAGRNVALALPRFIGAFGLGHALSILRRFTASVGVKIPSLGLRRFYSALPVQWGPYAAKYSFVPVASESGGAGPVSDGHFADDLATRLSRGPLVYDFSVQLFRDEATTPIEDGSVEWSEASAPFVKVGRLTIEPQDVRAPAGVKLGEYIEGLSFDPWHALVEHRPLGDMMRARSVAYRVSTQARHAAAEPDGSERFE